MVLIIKKIYAIILLLFVYRGFPETNTVIKVSFKERVTEVAKMRTRNYKEKTIYIDEEDEYQSELHKILSLCGHKQSKLLGLLAHDFVKRTGIDLSECRKDDFCMIMKMFEAQVRTGYNMAAYNHAAAYAGHMAMLPFQHITEKNSK